MKSKTRIYLMCVLSCLFLKNSAQGDTSIIINGGVIMNKMLGFYWLNGITAEMSSQRVFKGKLDLGLNVYTSSAGSAFLSNAIPVHAFEVYGQKRFRGQKKLNPLVCINLGFAKAFYGNTIFDRLPQSAFLLAPEFGLGYKIASKVNARLSLNYNVFSGNGVEGGGFIYPICLRFKLLFQLKG